MVWSPWSLCCWTACREWRLQTIPDTSIPLLGSRRCPPPCHSSCPWAPSPSLRWTYGQGSQKLYNWQNIVSPPHYRNDVHHPHDIICLYCRGLQDESEYIYFYIVYVSHLSSIDEYCRTFGSNTVILACLQTNIAHSNLLHKKSINCNQTI